LNIDNQLNKITMKYKKDSIEAMLRCIVLTAQGDNLFAKQEDLVLAFSLVIEKQFLERILEQPLDIEDNIVDTIKQDVIASVGEIHHSDWPRLLVSKDLDDYISICASKVISPELRERTLKASKKVASADGLHRYENYILKEFRKIWGVTD